MKRREPSERPSETQGLRAQLSRAVGGSIGAIRSVLTSSPKTVGVSKQRLHDVLWNDRTMLRTHETAVSHAAEAAAEELPESEVVELTPAEEVAVAAAVESSLEPVSADDAGDAESADAKSGEPRQRVDTRPSEIVRARLERVKARVATRLTTMPKGVAPIDGDVLEASEPTVSGDPSASDDAGEVAGAPEAPLESRTWLTTGTETERTKDEILDDLAPPAALAAPPAASQPEPMVPPAAVAAAPAPPKAAQPPAATTTAGDEEPTGEEPIRTRSMARLLAMQGHRARALRIYDALLAANGSDESLRAEADALRQAG